MRSKSFFECLIHQSVPTFLKLIVRNNGQAETCPVIPACLHAAVGDRTVNIGVACSQHIIPNVATMYQSNAHVVSIVMMPSRA
jgi:hypothetical protein